MTDLNDCKSSQQVIDLYFFYMAFYAMYQYQDLSKRISTEMATAEYDDTYYDTMHEMRPNYRSMKMYMALNLFSCVLKIFKFLRLSKRMNQLWEVLERAFQDMLGTSPTNGVSQELVHVRF